MNLITVYTKRLMYDSKLIQFLALPRQPNRGFRNFKTPKYFKSVTWLLFMSFNEDLKVTEVEETAAIETWRREKIRGDRDIDNETPNLRRMWTRKLIFMSPKLFGSQPWDSILAILRCALAPECVHICFWYFGYPQLIGRNHMSK